MEETLFEALKKYNKSMLPMHMPGHKRNSALSGEGGYLEALCAECDITEVAGFDNLAEPEGRLRSLKKRGCLSAGKRKYLWSIGRHLCDGTLRRESTDGP